MNLREMKQPTYRGIAAAPPALVACSVCASLVDRREQEQHTAWHREIVEWLQALRDTKADSII